MNFKDLKIGRKLGLAFGLIILITVILGSLAIINMRNVATDSNRLADEYVPALDVSTALNRNMGETMYQLLAFHFTLNPQNLTNGKEYMRTTKTEIERGNRLINSASGLQNFRQQLPEIDRAVNEYDRLIAETEQIANQINLTRTLLANSEKNFLQNLNSFIENMMTELNREIRANASHAALQERAWKIKVGNHILDQGNEVIKSLLMAQVNHDGSILSQIDNNMREMTKGLEELRPTIRQNQNILQLNQVQAECERFREAAIQTQRNIDRSNDLWQQRIVAGNQAKETTIQLAAIQMDTTTDITHTANQSLNRSNIIMIIGLFIALIIGITFAYIITRAITTPLVKGVAFAQSVATGDLTANVDVDQKDEIGDLALALKDMVLKLRDVIGSVINGSDNIAAASQQMSSTAQQMSQGGTEQASSAEEVSSSMEEMAANIQQNTDNARQTEKIARNAETGILESSKASEQAVGAMKDIAEKIGIIGEISRQTNILALNAAVEAARAGEHGKGFAVVAAEVRKLAERSQVAAAEIDKLSKFGVSISEEAGQKLAAIVPEIQKTARLVQEIAAASIEQNSGADQVNSAIQQLNQITQQNAAASEEMATSSEELSSQADQLLEMVSYFKLDMQASKRAQKAKNFAFKSAPGAPKFSAEAAKRSNGTKAKAASGVALDLNNTTDSDYEKF
jgi:methyl-accepting chemotaxis protein